MTNSPLAQLQIAQVVPVTEAEGPGRRFAIWLQGCPLRCPGCCNPEMLSFEGGTAVEVEKLLDDIVCGVRESGVEGITLLGGEPFAHAVGAAELAARVQQAGLSVMVFSGYTLAELEAMAQGSGVFGGPSASIMEQHLPPKTPDPLATAVQRLLEHTDILVDGPYLREQPETRRRWIGSANQQVHFLTDRYQADDPRWLLPNTLEIRLEAGELIVNGFPAAGATQFWRRLPQAAQH